MRLPETITVSGAPPILETETGSTNSTLEGSMINKLPITVAGRADTRTYVSRLPNAAVGGSNRMLINGARSAQVAWDEDGVTNKGPGSGAMMHQSSLNVESIKSWKYTLVNANAESQAPAQMSLLTRSGSNAFHGALYWDTHHSVFDANSHNAVRGSKKGFARDNFWGSHFSGPVYLPKLYDGRNRTFFMFTHELFRRPTVAPTFITTPTAAMRRGEFLRVSRPDRAGDSDPLSPHGTAISQ